MIVVVDVATYNAVLPVAVFMKDRPDGRWQIVQVGQRSFWKCSSPITSSSKVAEIYSLDESYET